MHVTELQMDYKYNTFQRDIFFLAFYSAKGISEGGMESFLVAFFF